MNRAELKTRYTTVAAAVDRFSSWTRRASVMELSVGEHNPQVVIHFRGGKEVTIVDREGLESKLSSRSIVHRYDPEGNLVERYRQGRPPKGYTKK